MLTRRVPMRFDKDYLYEEGVITEEGLEWSENVRVYLDALVNAYGRRHRE